MAPNYLSKFKNLILLAGILLVSVAGHAQMEYASAEMPTDYTTEASSDDDVIMKEMGTGHLENGMAIIQINPAIAALIDGNRIDDMVKISIQLEGNSNGIYVSKKTKDAFVISELQEGRSNAKFSYELVVKDL
ncbi:MAG: hypothetical protein KTR22_14265 [Flavobacteriaceae bacterium]|nr:hypothetical protein [Flavobacteriaceae bacterium]